MRHIGVEWRRKHLLWVLESKMMPERLMRDAFLEQLTGAITACREPLAANCPHSHMVQRKTAAWRYNMQGLWTTPLHKLPHTDHILANTGTPGTRDWVPWLNLNHIAVEQRLRAGHIEARRVPIRGYGTCPHLTKGKWTHRWNKTFVKDHAQYGTI